MLRHHVEAEVSATKHVGTNDMVADIMTKALERVKFERFRHLMKVLPIYEEQAISSMQVGVELCRADDRVSDKQQPREHERVIASSISPTS